MRINMCYMCGQLDHEIETNDEIVYDNEIIVDIDVM